MSIASPPSAWPAVRHGRPLAALAVACSALASPACQAQPSLALDQALQLAQARSRQLPAQDAAAAAAREMAVAAGQRPDPTLKLGLNNLPITGPDRFSPTRDFMTMRSVGVMQEITRADKLQARSARFGQEADSAEAARALALANLRRDTALAWLDRYHQERLRELLQAQRAETGLQTEAAEASYRGGRGTQAEVFAARAAVALIDDRIVQAERQVATATTRLQRWVGEAAAQPLAAPPPLSTVPLDSGRVESQLARHPEIVLLRQQEAVARADADIAQRNQRADWSVELMLSQRGPAYSTMVSLNLSMPLQLDPKNRQDRELAARLATVEQLRAQRDEALRERLADTRAWLQEWHGNRARLAQYDATLIPLSHERTRAATTAYQGGSGTLGAVLEARRQEIDTRIDRLRLAMETAGRWAQLSYLVPAATDTAATDQPASAAAP